MESFDCSVCFRRRYIGLVEGVMGQGKQTLIMTSIESNVACPVGLCFVDILCIQHHVDGWDFSSRSCQFG